MYNLCISYEHSTGAFNVLHEHRLESVGLVAMTHCLTGCTFGFFLDAVMDRLVLSGRKSPTIERCWLGAGRGGEGSSGQA